MNNFDDPRMMRDKIYYFCKRQPGHFPFIVTIEIRDDEDFGGVCFMVSKNRG